MAMKIRERVPAQTLRLSGNTGQYEPHLELTLRRFMGVLLHPVPLSEMGRQCNLNRRGCRVVAEWPPNVTESHPVDVGDVLQVGDHTYSIRGIQEHPGSYLEMYIDEV